MEVKGCDIVSRLDAVLLEQNIKRQALADRCGFSAANISRWKNLNSIPAADVLYNVSLCVGVSFEWLLTGKLREDELTIDERNILASWRNLDEQGQFEVKALLNAKSTPAPVKKTMQAG